MIGHHAPGYREYFKAQLFLYNGAGLEGWVPDFEGT